MDFVATSDNTSHILSLRPLQKILVTEDTDDQVDSTDAGTVCELSALK